MRSRSSPTRTLVMARIWPSDLAKSTSARTSTSSRSARRAPEARAHHPAGGGRAAVADAIVREPHAHWPRQQRGEGELLQLETELHGAGPGTHTLQDHERDGVRAPYPGAADRAAREGPRLVVARAVLHLYADWRLTRKAGDFARGQGGSGRGSGGGVPARGDGM